MQLEYVLIIHAKLIESLGFIFLPKAQKSLGFSTEYFASRFCLFCEKFKTQGELMKRIKKYKFCIKGFNFYAELKIVNNIFYNPIPRGA